MPPDSPIYSSASLFFVPLLFCYLNFDAFRRIGANRSVFVYSRNQKSVAHRCLEDVDGAPASPSRRQVSYSIALGSSVAAIISWDWP
uniref:Uncharacterized protein n=1 Tax=Kalanchoe fedtschenkoi TaxID=63787 RepID=A0A7N0V2N1_KALFE